MPGFLGFGNYTREGKGVNKGVSSKKGTALFFELLFRKFGSYVGINLTYLLTCTPAFLIVHFLLSLNLYDLANRDPAQQEPVFALATILAALITMIFSLSPLSSGFYYVLRNFSQEKHSWTISDFFEKFVENKKQSLIMYFKDLLIVCLLIFVVRAYIVIYAFSSIMLIPFIVLGILVLLYAITVPYKWTMAFTVNLKLRDIYKNSILFTLGELKHTIKYLLATGLYIAAFLTLFLKASLFGLLFFGLIGYSGFGLVQEMNIYPVIKRYLVDPQQKSEEE